MALSAYISKCEGVTSGPIESDEDQLNREGQIEVIGFSHEITSKKDVKSGRGTGLRKHGELKVTVNVGPHTPLFHHVLVTNELLSTVVIDFWANNNEGMQVNHYTIELTNASLSGCRTELMNNRYEENSAHPERNQLSFTYEKITWRHNVASKEASDSWKNQAMA